MSGETTATAAATFLLEKTLVGSRRAVDMEMFDFGAGAPVVDRRSDMGAIGAVRLHVQSRWRLVRAGVQYVEYSDILRPTTEAPDAPFDPDLGSRTLRDELLERFVTKTTADERTVEAVTITESGGLWVLFRDGAVLEADGPDPGSEKEAWRLLLPGGAHGVMSASGFRTMLPPA